MKMRNFAVIGAVAVLLAACIPSINPFYTDKDVVFDAHLIGTWQEKENADTPETWKFEHGENKAYKLTVTENDGKQGEFEAHLFKLNQDYFLDIVATEIGTNVAGLTTASLIPGHLLLRVLQFEPELKLAMVDFDWLDKYLKDHPKELAHRRDDRDRVFLTAETADLRGFVMQHLGEGELFSKGGEMIRKGKPTKDSAADK